MGAVAAGPSVGGFLGSVTGKMVPGSQTATDNMSSYGGAVNPNADENEYIRQLQGQAYGTSPNIALTKGLDQANAQAMALAASQRGINPALAARIAAQQQAQNQQAGVVAGMQQHQQNMGMLGNELQSVRTGQIQQQGNATAGNNAAMQAQGQVTGGLFSGAGAAAAMFANQGAIVPGQAEVGGDSLKNDKVPAMLSPGEAVIPRSIMNSDNPGEKAKEFIEALKEHQTSKKASAPDFAKVIKMHREMGEHLEKLCMGGKVGK